MGIDLDPISRSLPYSHFKMLAVLINHQRLWLEKERPEVAAEYGNAESVYEKLIVSAADFEYARYVVRHQKLILGMATIAFDQTLRHPTQGNIEGNVIDYWLHEELSYASHTQTAFALLAEQEDEHPRRSRLPVARALGVISVNQTHPPLGISKIMSPIGESAVLTTPDESDPYNLTKHGELTQLYAVQQSLDT